MYRFEDTDMWRRISKSYCIGAIQEYTCKLRTHGGNSLLSQDPNQIRNALDYYAEKILREDSHMSPLARRKGLAGIYFYYGGAMWLMSRWKDTGLKLLLTAFRYWPLVFAMPSILSYLVTNSKHVVRRPFSPLSATSLLSRKCNREERDIPA
jgi:hypothetical protein